MQRSCTPWMSKHDEKDVHMERSTHSPLVSLCCTTRCPKAGRDKNTCCAPGLTVALLCCKTESLTKSTHTLQHCLQGCHMPAYCLLDCWVACCRQHDCSRQQHYHRTFSTRSSNLERIDTTLLRRTTSCTFDQQQTTITNALTALSSRELCALLLHYLA